MHSQVALRKEEIRQEINENGTLEIRRNDVFSRLVLANESETEKLPLDDEELVRNSMLNDPIIRSTYHKLPNR